MTSWPEGALVERVDRPSLGLTAISLGGSSRRACLLIAASARRVRWAITSERPRGEAADASVRGLREKLEGGRVAGAWDDHGALAIEVHRGEQVVFAIATRAGLAVKTERAPSGVRLDADAIAKAEARGVTFLAEHARDVADDARTSALAALTKARGKLEKRVAAIANDVSAIAIAEAAAARAALFVVAAKQGQRGATALVATDYATGEDITFALDAARSPREQIDAVFARAKRLRAGQTIADARRTEAEIAIARLDEAIAQLAEASDAAAVTTLVARAARHLPVGVRLDRRPPPAARVAKEERLPYKAFRASNGDPIWVGRGAADNDALTTTHARPGDLFLHAKGAVGAHVIVPGGAKKANAKVLVEAAMLAAHFSDQRGEAVVDIQHADRRHVRKRKGSPVGLVELTQEKVLAVRVDAAVIARLLATEGR